MASMEHKKLFFLTLISIVIIAILFFVPLPPPSDAFFGPSSSDPLLGGRVGAIISCSCSGTRLIFVGPPKAGSFILSPGSTIFDIGGISIGDNVVGLAKGFSLCIRRVGKFCVPVGGGPVIDIIGSS